MELGAASEADAAAIAAMRNAAAERLTAEFGRGPWSAPTTEAAVRRAFESSRVLVACAGGSVVGALRLSARKPWSIDPRLFTSVEQAIYLTEMVIAPAQQRRGTGRLLVDQAARIARAWPGDALRLDAWDAPAGAGEFYEKCGFREVGRGRYRGAKLIYFERLL